jgi:hypothetical protein
MTANRIFEGVKQFSQTYAAQGGQIELLDFNLVKDSTHKMGAAAIASESHGGDHQATSGPTVRFPDPLLPDEDMAEDTQFTIGWVVAVNENPKVGNSDKPGK